MEAMSRGFKERLALLFFIRINSILFDSAVASTQIQRTIFEDFNFTTVFVALKFFDNLL
jgi:hypothetical protein